ncbi:GDSL-type esterase/lipase family protein [Nonomuraea bangladeshensis]|uniref:GDSL-type esterase/lipase family protein n=1 Tax=Nonomuraea bangladeshensis TaxID=404385 RepID=UPI0031D039F8
MRRRLLHLTRAAALGLGALVVLCAVSIWLSIRVTPMAEVSAAGQTVRVGAALPGITLSGPGELDLFGQTIPTQLQFPGPIRPRLELARITVDAQVASLIRSGDHRNLELRLSRELASGWRRYCIQEIAVAGGFAALFVAAAAAVRRSTPVGTLKAVAAGVVGVCVVNAAAAYLMAANTPAALRQVHSLGDLVGLSPSRPTPPAQGPPLSGVQAVVIGDSTAAAVGNPLVERPDTLDRACGRSKDSYAAYLAAANGWNVINLACSGATVRDGLLGPQILGDRVAPPQLAVAQRATTASVIIVSVGANDLGWPEIIKVCAASRTCADRLTTAYFQQQLAAFSRAYAALLRQLAALPQRPAVLVNEYYDPLSNNVGCLKPEGMTLAKAKALRSLLDVLNTVLAEGAKTFGFTAVRQHFAGHGVCSYTPFVQGLSDKAPLHPTVAGQLAIALADQHALARAGLRD